MKRKVEIRSYPAGLMQDEEEAADGILNAVSNLAYKTDAPTGNQNVPKKRESRFFFRLTTSLDQEVTNLAHKQRNKPLDHINTAVETRAAIYRDRLPPVLETNISAVREFFLREIAPKTLAAQAGIAQSKAVVESIVGTVDGPQFNQFDKMLSEAIMLKMAAFIQAYMKLPKSKGDALSAATKPKVPYVIPNQDPGEGWGGHPVPRSPKRRRAGSTEEGPRDSE